MNKEETARRKAQQREVKRIQKELIETKNTLKFKLRCSTNKEEYKRRNKFIKLIQGLTKINIINLKKLNNNNLER